VVPGTDRRRGECVVLSAHWDAFGTGTPVNGDPVYNGALDNASGVASVLAVAPALAARPLRRSVPVVLTTAEEMGLLGARAFVCDGPLPARRLVANLNVDAGLELSGPKRDVLSIGAEWSHPRRRGGARGAARGAARDTGRPRHHALQHRRL
jgi:acetylornithine deacetylase/succinyl-diaminopimelate desuccinylase-like protein